MPVILSVIGAVIVYRFHFFSMPPMTSRTFSLKERWEWSQMLLRWGPLVYR